MSTDTSPKGVNEIPNQVFERFLKAVTDAGLSNELTTRLRKTLIEDEDFGEDVLRAAVLGEESIP